MQASPGNTSVPTKVIKETINKVIKPNKILLIIKNNIIKITALDFKINY